MTMTGTDHPDYHLPSLPLWRGVQASPGIAKAFPFRLGWDRSGFIRQTTPGNVRDQVVAEYADPNYQYMTTPPGGSAWANRLGDKYVAAIRDLAGVLRGKRILEIGAGSTYIAERLLDDFGVGEYVIVDPAITETAGNGRAGLNVIQDYYPSDRVKGRTFDLVIALNCLEHVEDPIRFLTRIRDAMADNDSRAVLVFPDVTAQFERGDLNVLLHEHLNYFDGDGTGRVLASAGLMPVHRYSEIDTWFILAGPANTAPPPADPVENDLLGATAALFDGVVRNEGETIRKMLDGGETVLFHGAVNGLNTFFYLTGLGGRENIRLVDGDDTKAGCFLPACSRAVEMPSRDAYESAKTIYVSAVTFFDEIRNDLMRTRGVSETKIRPLFRAPEPGQAS